MRLVQFEPLFIRHFTTMEWPFPLHNHNHYELMFIRKGSGIHELNQIKMDYSGEILFFLNPEDSHDFQIGEETSFSVIKFLPSVLKGGVNASSSDYWENLLNNLGRKWKTWGAELSDPKFIERVKAIVDLMVAEWADNNYKVSEVHTNLLRGLLLIIDRSMKESVDNNMLNYGSTKIERIQSYIHAHIYFPEKLTVKNLSNELGLSESGLRGLFRTKMEMSLRSYISALKLEMIKERMKNSDSTISEIGQEFGFTDTSHFNKFFKKQTEMNPLHYRKKNLKIPAN